MDKKNAEQIATRFFEAIDNRDWKMFESTMIDRLDIHMKSPEGERKNIETREEISTMWQQWFAMIYDKTRHVIKNLEVVLRDDKAIVKVDIDSTHYLGNENWTGIGTYIFIIKTIDGDDKIIDIDYMLQIVDGDVGLRSRMLALRK